MTLRTYYVVVTYHPKTQQISLVHPPDPKYPLSKEEAQSMCDDLNPDSKKFTRCRVGTLTIEED